MTDGDSIGVFAFWLAMGFVALGFFFGPIGKALGRRLEPARKTAGPDESRIGELESRIAELEQVPTRMAEIEERVDFAERMLAQHREAPRVGEGGG